jgi:hypothetical protein
MVGEPLEGEIELPDFLGGAPRGEKRLVTDAL